MAMQNWFDLIAIVGEIQKRGYELPSFLIKTRIKRIGAIWSYHHAGDGRMVELYVNQTEELGLSYGVTLDLRPTKGHVEEYKNIEERRFYRHLEICRADHEWEQRHPPLRRGSTIDIGTRHMWKLLGS